MIPLTRRKIPTETRTSGVTVAVREQDLRFRSNLMEYDRADNLFWNQMESVWFQNKRKIAITILFHSIQTET